MRVLDFIWQVRPRDLGKSWLMEDQLIIYQVMPDGSRERVQIKMTQERVDN